MTAMLLSPGAVAQTNIQLYNQLIARAMPQEGLALVRRAYDFLATIYPGYLQADGKPFIAHGVGVASILAHLGMPPPILAVGLLHNVYGNGDFGDGLTFRVDGRRRRIVRDAVGAEVEGELVRLRPLRVNTRNAAAMAARLDGLDAASRRLLAVDLADHLEKFVDGGVLYFGDNRWVVDEMAACGRELVAIAEGIGHPALAEALEAAGAMVAAGDGLARQHGLLAAEPSRRYLVPVTPRSCRRRLVPILAAHAQRAWRRLRRVRRRSPRSGRGSA